MAKMAQQQWGALPGLFVAGRKDAWGASYLPEA